ncbi:MAG TPA: isoaspartyl peptidase/L-asparaginase [Candidatus Krumholzibacteria bacterium]|nr:isoaspartyl peptidase/L-asparaginase [Candidatus Krumholzibacteria bacterium]
MNTATHAHLLPLTLALISLVIPAESARPSEVALVIHGGAGTILRDQMTPEREAALRAALTEALETGYRILQNGGSSLDAVEAAVCVLEDSPLFNAGRGAVFTSEGKNEMDAAIMDGATRKAGAVASVKGIKNPVKAARSVMERTSHVMLVGEGAEKFAREQGLQFEDSAYFFTQHRWDELKRTQEKEKELKKEYGSLAFPHTHLGTVGAVALDQNGNLAAATSTGGLTNKRWGRVGDSPIIGAGTYADNATCAVSCTGRGEVFIRAAAAHEVSALMRLEGFSVEKAAKRVVHEELVELGGEGTGGLIALDRKGRFAMECNTPGMYRGFVGADGKARTFIYRDE